MPRTSGVDCGTNVSVGRLSVVDLEFPVLHVRFPQGDIRIRGLLQQVLGGQQPGARIDEAKQVQAILDAGGQVGIDVRVIVEWNADGVEHRVRPQNRQDKVRAFRDTPHGKCLGKILVIPFHAARGCDVKDAADPQRAVEQEAAEFIEAALRFSLQEIIHRGAWRRQVREDIGEAAPDRRRHEALIALGERFQREFVDRGIQPVHLAVKRFERVISRTLAILGARIAAGAAANRQAERT